MIVLIFQLFQDQLLLMYKGTSKNNDKNYNINYSVIKDLL